MKIIEPTHKEIMQSLNCRWFGSYRKGQCECNNRCQFKDCYENEKRRLTRTKYTEEEIKQAQERNAKAMNDINSALDELWGKE